jgi:hypothetical protein
LSEKHTPELLLNDVHFAVKGVAPIVSSFAYITIEEQIAILAKATGRIHRRDSEIAELAQRSCP